MGGDMRAAVHLVRVIRRECLRSGGFSLASGKMSSFYIDIKKLTLSHDIARVCAMMDNHCKAFSVPHHDAVAGMETAANQIVGAYLTYLAVAKSVQKRGGIVKKRQKGHGLKDLIIGTVQPGDKVLLVDDVATTGKSMLRAANALRRYGCEVVHALCIVDRMEGAECLMQGHGIPFSSLVTVEALGITETTCT